MMDPALQVRAFKPHVCVSPSRLEHVRGCCFRQCEKNLDVQTSVSHLMPSPHINNPAEKFQSIIVYSHCAMGKAQMPPINIIMIGGICAETGMNAQTNFARWS